MSKVKTSHKIRSSNLKLQRFRTGMTQQELAEALGCEMIDILDLDELVNSTKIPLK